jgi:hypothetical protein
VGKSVGRLLPALVGLGLLALAGTLNARFDAGTPLFRAVPPQQVILLCCAITLAVVLVWFLVRGASREAR